MRSNQRSPALTGLLNFGSSSLDKLLCLLGGLLGSLLDWLLSRLFSRWCCFCGSLQPCDLQCCFALTDGLRLWVLCHGLLELGCEYRTAWWIWVGLDQTDSSVTHKHECTPHTACPAASVRRTSSACSIDRSRPALLHSKMYTRVHVRKFNLQLEMLRLLQKEPTPRYRQPWTGRTGRSPSRCLLAIHCSGPLRVGPLLSRGWGTTTVGPVVLADDQVYTAIG